MPLISTKAKRGCLDLSVLADSVKRKSLAPINLPREPCTIVDVTPHQPEASKLKTTPPGPGQVDSRALVTHPTCPEPGRKPSDNFEDAQ